METPNLSPCLVAASFHSFSVSRFGPIFTEFQGWKESYMSKLS